MITTPSMLQVERLHVHHGAICALRNVSLAIQSGEAMALLGRNGAGKSTLLKAIAGLPAIMRGQILWKGEPVARWRKEIAYLPQREEVDWNFPITVRGLVEMGRYTQLGPWGKFRSVDEEAVESALQAMELGPLANRQIRQLSGGQQQRTFIARAMAQEARVLLLDEPFAGLDKSAAELLSRLIHRLTSEGRLIIASHHDLNTAEEIFSQALLLNREQVAFGPVRSVLTQPHIETAFGNP